MSLTRVDFPEPLTPVITTNPFKGISTSIFCKLCLFIPEILIFLVKFFLDLGIGMLSVFVK